MKIKGLYFKLNMEKVRDRIVYIFFNTQTGNKIDVLYMLINYYLSKGEVDELAAMCIDNKGGAENEQIKH